MHLLRHITVSNYVQNFAQYSSVKVNSECRLNYFRSFWWITNQVLYICQIPENKWEYSGAVHNYSAIRKDLYDVFIQWGIHMNIGSENEIFLNERSSKVRLGRYLPDTFLVQNGLKQCDA